MTMPDDGARAHTDRSRFGGFALELTAELRVRRLSPAAGAVLGEDPAQFQDAPLARLFADAGEIAAVLRRSREAGAVSVRVPAVLGGRGARRVLLICTPTVDGWDGWVDQTGSGLELAAADEGAALLSPSGEILAHSPAFAELCGLDARLSATSGAPAHARDLPEPIAALVSRALQAPGTARHARLGDGRHLEAVAWSVAEGLLVTFRDVSEEYRLTRRLQEAEATYRELFRRTNEGLYLAGPGGQLRDANPALAGMLGYDSPEQMLAENAARGLHADPSDAAWLLGQLARYNSVLGVEHALRQRDGGTCQVLESARAQRDETGRLVGYQGQVQDISERRRAERALEENAARLRRAMEMARIGMTLYSTDGELIEASSEVGEILGLSAPDFQRRLRWPEQAARFMHPDDLGAWRSLWQRAAKQLRVAQGELRIVRADGETRVCRVAFEPILDRNGQLDRISGTVQDVTDVRRLEERMAVRDRELALLAANLPGCIIRMIRHPDGSYAYPLLTGQLADAWHARFGEGLDLDAVLTPEGGGSFREALEAHAAAPGDLEMICSFPARDGELGWLRLTARGRADDAGEVRWTGLLLEITEQRQIAQRLRAAERMESLGTLAGGVAHDFNNALQPLVQYAEYLVGALEGAREREAAQQILDGAHHATGLVRQILTYARDIQGEEPERHALNELVRERVGLVHASMPPAVELVLAVEQRVDVVIDPTHLQQILMNLCSNALHALDGSGRIEVGVRRVSARGPIDTADRVLDAGDWAVLFVCDTGPGIAPEKFSRVLEPFFTTKPPDQGTGLGLSVVHGIAINLGGGIAISNRPEGGACFEVYLPPA